MQQYININRIVIISWQAIFNLIASQTLTAWAFTTEFKNILCF